MVRFDVLYAWKKHGMFIWYIGGTVWWYVYMLVVWYDGTVSWMYYMVKLACCWYNMFQYIRSLRVKYVVRISSVTILHIDHCKVFESISQAARHTYRQTDSHLSQLRLSLQSRNMSTAAAPVVRLWERNTRVYIAHKRAQYCLGCRLEHLLPRYHCWWW